jgi:uncharacterized protein YjbI with pentapeptide repeats
VSLLARIQVKSHKSQIDNGIVKKEAHMSNENTPKNSPHPLYLALRAENMEKFNSLRAIGEKCDLSGVNLRDLDLRGADLHGLDLSNAYLRQCDLRGLDLSTCSLDGASLRAAKVSGVLFPKELAAEEITMSLNFGTRMRYRK